MSTTIRVLDSDKERLERLAKRVGAKTLVEALRLALSAAERENDSFNGNTEALREALKFASPVGGNVSERVDEELGKVLE